MMCAPWPVNDWITLTLSMMQSLLGLLMFSIPSNLTDMALLVSKLASTYFKTPSQLAIGLWD